MFAEVNSFLLPVVRPLDTHTHTHTHNVSRGSPFYNYAIFWFLTKSLQDYGRYGVKYVSTVTQDLVERLHIIEITIYSSNQYYMSACLHVPVLKFIFNSL